MEKLVTVILTAYNRREFLKDALNSILGQTLPKELLQVIVIKNFLDQDLDKLIEENGGESIIVDNCSVGVMLKIALERAQCDVVSFLDDDDLFTPNKLELVQNKFMEHPDLIYFHNSQRKFTEITGSSKLLRPSDTHDENEEVIFSTGKYFVKRLTKLSPIQRWKNFFFNLSSISIRKEYYEQFFTLLGKITGHTDDFFFFNAFNNNSIYKIIFSEEDLTLYRVHNSTAQIHNADSSSLKKISILDDFITTTQEMSKNAMNEELAIILKYRLYSEIFERSIYTKDYTNNLSELDSIKEGIKFLIMIANIVSLDSFIFILRRYIHSQFVMRINRLKTNLNS